jgi:type IV secretion system protein VirB10
MRAAVAVLCLSVFAVGQDVPAQPSSTAAPAESSTARTLTIPAGTKVPLVLKHAISTKSAQVGDPVYAETSFPFVLDDHVLIPAGTYVQGKISRVQRAGRVKGRAEVLIHFTTLIYPSGYTVVLPGSIENIPGAENTNMKGEEGAIQQRGEKGKDIGRAASTAATGGLIGAAAGGGKGAGIGAGAGGVAGLAIALLSRGSDVRLEAGSTLEMVIQRAVRLDASRVPAVTR